jgi:hypothetical protein
LFFKLAGFPSKQPFGSRTQCHAHEMEIISSGNFR